MRIWFSGQTGEMDIGGKRLQSLIGLFRAVLIAWAFLAAGMWQLLGPVHLDVLRVADTAVSNALRAWPVQRQLAAYIGAQLLLHAMFGVAIWVLAVASKRCYPNFRLPITSWAIVLCGAIYVSNAAIYPSSTFASVHDFVTAAVIGTITIFDGLIILIGTLAISVLVRAVWSFDRVRRRERHIIAAGLLGTSVALWLPAFVPDRIAVNVPDRPHVIVIGVDSLRTDLVRRTDAFTFAPHLRTFVRGSVGFPDATTPLGRTFASWTTILSGRHPVHTGARDSLVPQSALNLPSTLAARLRSAGYATVFATDEVRYSNIDESFGFDRIVSPPMGAADFLIGKLSDLPLSNLLANTRVGAWLLPSIYGNRAVAPVYRPETFVQWVDRSVDFEQPTLLTVHLTLSHWPYFWADTLPSEHIAGTFHPNQYIRSVSAVDQQFGSFIQALRKRGVLNNAIVVALSDHGEALGLEQDELVARDAAEQLFGSSIMSGHGTSVFSPSQYQVLLAIRRYGAAQVKGRSSDALASLEDIAPTVLAMIGLPFAPLDFDGVSLAQELAQPDANADGLRSRVRFTETGLTPSSLRAGNFSEADNLSEGLEFFAVDKATGRIVLNDARLPELIARKERAAFDDEWLLAAIPHSSAPRQQYVLVRRSGGDPEIVTEDPDAVSNPQFMALWQALQHRFGREVLPKGE